MENLPEEIKLRVMSLLPLKEAARTSIVATNWRQLWTCYPNLCFDGSNDDCSTDDSTVKLGKANFIATVNSIIQQHSGAGIDKLGITYSLKTRSWSHLDQWIAFAAASKAKVIDINLLTKRAKIRRGTHVYSFPLEALGAHQEGPFIQSLALKYVSIKSASNLGTTCGFTKLRRLLLHYVRVIGDLPGLLNGCGALEDLELISCYGVADLNVPQRLNKLRHLVISKTRVQTVDFHVSSSLAHFQFSGDVIPMALHGCSNLEEATIDLKDAYDSESQNNNNNTAALYHAFTAIPFISAVEVLNVQVYMAPIWLWASQPQVQALLMTKPTHMFNNLKHLTCETKIMGSSDPNSENGILQLAHYLTFAPHLETLQLHMKHWWGWNNCWQGEVTGEEVSCCMSRLHHLKTVYMSGFRCYRAQVELLCNVLKRSAMLEHVTLDPKPKVTIGEDYPEFKYLDIRDEHEIREWADRTSQRFGKTITVVAAVQEEPAAAHQQ